MNISKQTKVSDVEFQILESMLNYKNPPSDGKIKYFEKIGKTREGKKKTRPWPHKEGWLNMKQIYLNPKANIGHPQTVRKYLRGDEKPKKEDYAIREKGLIQKGFVEEKQFGGYYDGRRWTEPWFFRLRRTKTNFLKLYAIFFERSEANTFSNSDYIEDNFKKPIIEYNLMIQRLFDTETVKKEKGAKEIDINWVKRQTRKGILKYHTPEDPVLFYYYAKDRKKFQQTISFFVENFQNIDISPSHFKQLLTVSLRLATTFDMKFNDQETYFDFEDIITAYKSLINVDIYPELAYLKVLKAKT